MKPNSDPLMESILRPYSSYKPTPNPWVGQIPQHWQTAPGKAVYLTKQTINVGMRESTVLSLSYGRLRIRDEAELHGLVPASFETYQKIQPGDIVCRPTDLQNDWNSLRFGHSDYQGIITSAYLCFQTRTGIDPRYGHLLLHTYDLKKVFYGLGSGLRQNLDWSDFKYLPCLVPPPEEQAAIVRYLDHADELISRYIGAKERLIALLEEQRKTVIHQAVTRGLHPNVSLTPSGIPSLGDVPAHWDLRRAKFTYHESDQRSDSGVEELMSVSHITGVTPRKQNVTMFLAQSNEGYKLCRPGDIVVNTMWAYMAALGVARQSGLVSPSYGVYRPRVDGLVNPEYMDLLLRTENYRVEYTRRSKGITASRLRLYPDDFLDIPFLRPPTNEQTHIVKYLRRATANVDSTIDRTHRQIALMNEYRTRLIADVVTGQIDVRNATVELPD